MLRWIVESEEAGLTLLEILQRRLPAAPVGYLRQLLKKGRIEGAAGPWRGEQRPAVDDIIDLPESGRMKELLLLAPPEVEALRILYQSREILVVDKPAGLAVHAGVGHEQEHLTGCVQAYLQRNKLHFQVAPVHRLDLDSSGPVMFGKGRKACAELGRLFQAHQVEKTYLALVKGTLPGAGVLTSPVSSKGKQKSALTYFRTVGFSSAGSLVELDLVTGRQHQIRRQLAELGHPLFGDRRYGGPSRPGLQRTFLHCLRLAFTDPFSGAPLVIESELPQELRDFLDRLKIPR